MSALRRSLFPALLVVLAAPAVAQQRTITQTDLYHFKWVANPQISPDGRQVAYVLVTVTAKHDGYETSIWTVPAEGGGGPRQLTAGPHDAAPRWSPDGRTLAFVRSRDNGPPQIYLLAMAGGEAVQLTDAPRGASAPVWAPDGKSIAYTSRTRTSDLAEPAHDTTHASSGDSLARRGDPPDTASDVHVITRAIFRINDVGYLDPTRHQHIWVVPVAAPGAPPARGRQITSGKYDEGEITWSPDGARIYFTTDRVDEPYYYPENADLYAVAATGGSTEKVADIDGPIVQPSVAPDGKSYAFYGYINPTQTRSYNQPDLFVWQGGRVTNLTASYDFDVGSDVTGDQAPPRGRGSEPVLWTADGRSVIIATTEHGTANLVRVDVGTGRIEPLTTGRHTVLAFSATPGASRIALTISDATHIGDVYLLDPATKALTQLTHVNDSLFAQLRLSEPEPFWYRSFDGRRVEGWVLKPPTWAPGRKYPLILEIHGGPHTAYGDVFMHEFQWMAAKGYVVLYTNPRGSTSYGQEFGNIIQYRYPGDDYKDLMVAVDSLVRRGYVDEKRLGVTGGSGGGLLTNWTVTQTHRFAAAVSQRSVADWAAFWYSADFTLFRPSWFRAPPYEDPQEYVTRSPTTYAGRITTPLMLIGGENDLRTPPGQGAEAMFRSLKAQKKPTVLILFPGESHELSRSGKPVHRVERLQHILNWFDKYLLGAPITLYDHQ
ncbi:MAG: S9 family peptidase [Gemmatimonadaceae bacterium]|nr:S9 family peptidase [Gemmatimonadaceae bacterium]